MHKGVIACEDNTQNELQCVESCLSSLLREDTNLEKMKLVQEKLEAECH
jgi:hypothetical protein